MSTDEEAPNTSTKSAPTTGLVALIAHNGKKDDIAQLARRHEAALASVPLVATSTTGGVIERAATSLRPQKVLSGPQGGDLQIGAMIAEGRVRAVIFLRDPLEPHPHEPDISALMKVCDTHNVPLATNVATADVLLSALSP